MIGFNRLRRAGRDDGFALIYVMLVTAAIMAAVTTTLTVTTPNIVNSANQADSSAALAAAQAGVDDFIAYLDSVSACRSTTRVCAEALNDSSTLAGRSGLSGTNQSFSWYTDPTLTSDDYVRLHTVGHAGGITRKLTADISLAPSILSFGYYTNYESQSPTYLDHYYDARQIRLSDPNTYQYVSLGWYSSLNSSATMAWNGASETGSYYPSSVCGEHWYSDSGSSGRQQTGSVWGETGTLTTSGGSRYGESRTSSCDVEFMSGMTMDGPLYTRDALLISDNSGDGTGPRFNQPVYSLWGFPGYNTPAPGANPWRSDGDTSQFVKYSPYKPQVAGLDLQLEPGIGTDGLPTTYCVYYGPTRVKLNGDGTATVTSPSTTKPDPASPAGCYPSDLTGGIVDFTLNYTAVGNGVIYVKNLGSVPSGGWPQNPTRSTNTPGPSNSVFYLATPVSGSATPSADSDSATDACTGSSYSAAGQAGCAWTGVAGATDGATSSTGWTTYGRAYCSSAAATNRQRFECDYGQLSGSARPGVNLAGGYYDSLRTSFQQDLAKGTCISPSGATPAQCLSSLLNDDLKPANSGQHPAGYTSPAPGDHQYVVTATTTGTAAQGVAQAAGAAPTPPAPQDSFFSATSTPAQETPTDTPITLTVSRETANSSKVWGSPVPQFTVTVTQAAHWQITSAPTAGYYFPNVDDVTQYNTGADAAGNAAGSTGTAQPGDLYVEGTNTGNLSLLADNDVVVTGNIVNPADSGYADVYNPAKTAIDIAAGGNVRNYHPVECVSADRTPADVTATSPGWCPNDITGLYNTILESNGANSPPSPPAQYQNMTPAAPRTIDAAIFAMSGSFLTDNYDRGTALGKLTVNGGIYQSHRGANGVSWPAYYGDARPSTGYSLQYHYIDLEHASLPYAPPATGGSNSRVWNVVSISAGGS